ncbi:ABC transporter permease subunit [Actinoplanes sp. NEAU-A12]|uniref:ABC transporter permease subunit n=1 Tax=Actinoplanes sandaracinus TaxID=3045177 RepID=A0ABT6WSQ0_9ACTN|nr:ABC transporter permease subunit [Actinoplanes sandaracinus]MDI6102696.1 ABC transporter permease subunit [Actinoplanes sandaracinus]
MTGRPHRLGRVGALACAVGALTVVVAALPWLRGDDPARSVLRARLEDREIDPAALAAVRSELHLAGNPLQGAADWLIAAARGDFGTSWVAGVPVRDLLLPAAGASASLAAAASVVAVVVGVALVAPVAWALSGERRSPGRCARGVRVAGAVVAALSEVALAAALLILVGVRWRLVPVAGWFGPSYMLLPALALGVPTGGLFARLVVIAADVTAEEPWVRTWRAVGCGRITLTAGIVRRAVTVAVPQVAVLFAGLLGGAVVVEQMFAVPGLGRLSLQAALAQDLPVVQGCVLTLVLAGTAAGASGIVAQRVMLGAAGAAATLVPAAPARSLRPRRRTPLVMAAVLTAPILAGLLRDPHGVRLEQRLSVPSWAYPLGTDPVGRDVLARFGHGAVLTIGLAAAVTAAGLLVGLVVGLRGSAARVGVVDILNALPFVLIGLTIAAVLGPGLVSAAISAALVACVPIVVHTRSLAAEVRASGYHQAAVLAGAGAGWILRRHLLPAVIGPVLAYAVTRVPSTALAIAALGFLGIGAGHDTPEWGAELSVALDYLERAPTLAAAPVLGLILLGVLAGFAPAELGQRPAD